MGGSKHHFSQLLFSFPVFFSVFIDVLTIQPIYLIRTMIIFFTTGKENAMPDMKAAITSSEPAVSPEKDLAMARRSAELQSSEVLIQKVSASVAEQREKARASAQEKRPEKSKDTAQISETRRWSRTDGTVCDDETGKWTLEMAEDWEAFLEWQPDLAIGLQKQLQYLSDLYLSLLGSALRHAEGEELEEQLARLDALLAEKLELVLKEELQQLTTLLEKTGQTSTLDGIRSSLYRQTAGRTISYQAAHTLFTRGAAGAAGNGPFPTCAVSAHSREGMIYRSSGGQKVRFQQTSHTQQGSWKEQIRQRDAVIANARKGIGESSFKQGSAVSCSGKELARANRFAAHIDGIGNLFKAPGITARNPEVTGFLAAVMSIKGQVYAGGEPRTGSISFLLQDAIAKLIDPYLRQKEASKIYYRTLSAYAQTKNPQKAIEEGLDHACRQFREKQKDPAYQRSPHYSKDSGFFRALLKGLSPEKEFALGVAVLKKDWQDLLYAIGDSPSSPHLSRAWLYSPWGALADPGAHGTGSDGTVAKIIAGAAVIVLLGLLAGIGLRFL